MNASGLYSPLCSIFIACNINNHLEIHFQSISLKTVLKSIITMFEKAVKNFIFVLCLDIHGLSINIKE
jgi:hypothetical protein